MHLLPQKGSILVFSLIILSIILSAAITVATVSVTNKRSSSATGKSVQSFQVADSGIELALQKIYKNTYTDLNAMATGMGGGASCSGGTISKNNVVGGAIKVSFYDNDGNLLSCTASDWRNNVVRIKSEGSAFGTTRVVETAVAAGVTATGLYGWCSNNWGGNQCDSSSDFAPAACGTGGCGCPSGYTKVPVGTCNFGTCLTASWNTDGTELYFYSCYKN